MPRRPRLPASPSSRRSGHGPRADQSCNSGSRLDTLTIRRYSDKLADAPGRSRTTRLRPGDHRRASRRFLHQSGGRRPDRDEGEHIRGRLTQPDVTAGFVLGFPNHAVTAVALDALLSEPGTPIDRAIDLVLPDAEVLRRLIGRRTCRNCARTWHTELATPTSPNVCDRCGSEPFQRHDDHPERTTVALDRMHPRVLAAAPPIYASRGSCRRDRCVTSSSLRRRSMVCHVRRFNSSARCRSSRASSAPSGGWPVSRRVSVSCRPQR